MRVGRDIKDQLSGFESAAAEMEQAMKAVRELDIRPHNEMKSGKLPDVFSVFKKRMGPKEGEESETTLEEEESKEEEPKEKDDEVDFDVSDEDAEFEEAREEEEEDVPEEPPEPVWPDIMNGPLTGGGAFDVEPYTGKSRFPYATEWPVHRPEKGILPDGLGFRAVYQHKHGHFTTVSPSGGSIPWWASKGDHLLCVGSFAQGSKDGPGTVEGRGTQKPHETEQTPSGHSGDTAGDVWFQLSEG